MIEILRKIKYRKYKIKYKIYILKSLFGIKNYISWHIIIYFYKKSEKKKII